jgi:hypothetical protein
MKDELTRVILALQVAAFDVAATSPSPQTASHLARAIVALTALDALPHDEREQRNAIAAFLLDRFSDLTSRGQLVGTVH